MSFAAFTGEDAKGIIYPYDEPLVVSLHISNVIASLFMLAVPPPFYSCRLSRKWACESRAWNWSHTQWSDSQGHFLSLKAPFQLPIKLGEGPQSQDLMVEFLVVNVSASYNTITGQPLIHDAHSVVSAWHLTMIYTSNSGKSKDWMKTISYLGHVTLQCRNLHLIKDWQNRHHQKERGREWRMKPTKISRWRISREGRKNLSRPNTRRTWRSKSRN